MVSDLNPVLSGCDPEKPEIILCVILANLPRDSAFPEVMSHFSKGIIYFDIGYSDNLAHPTAVRLRGQ